MTLTNQITLLFACLSLCTEAFAGQIVADPSDFEVVGTGECPGDADLGDLVAGDTGGDDPNLGRRSLLRFSLAGLYRQTIESASLNLFVIQSRRDQYPAPGIIDVSPPFINPGLDDVLVIHVSDYGVPAAAAYRTFSIGNDPGVLIPDGFEPGRQVTVSVRDAMQQAINARLPFVTLRLQTSVETDGDGLNDVWFFGSGNAADSGHRPFLEFSTVREPSGSPEVDQEQPIVEMTGTTLAIGGNSQQKIAQVVTAGISGFLTEVRFPVSCAAFADLVVEIQGVTDGRPNGTVLNSEVFAGENLTNFFISPGVVSFKGFAFAIPTRFSAGEQFAVVLNSTGTTAFPSCGLLQGPVGDSYPGGQAYFDSRPNAENVWVCICEFRGGRFDLPFQTVMAPTIIEVPIDIRPGEFPNNINRKSRGKIPVAILSTAQFDVMGVDRSSITFGSTGEEASAARFESADVNGDGLPDLICHFSTQEAQFNATDVAGILKAQTMDGTNIRGTDSIRIVPPLK